MKQKSILFIFAVIFFTFQSFSKKSQEVKVWGNCGMCKKVIEESATKAGAKEANWSEEKNILRGSYKAKRSDLHKIKTSIPAAGYDTQDFTAPDEIYAKLHSCYRYMHKAKP